MLGELNLTTTKGRERDVRDLHLAGWSTHFGCVMLGTEVCYRRDIECGRGVGSSKRKSAGER